MKPEETKKKETKEKVAAQVKGLKKQAKKAVKQDKVMKEEQKDFLTQLEELLDTDDTAADKLQELLNKRKKVEQVIPPVAPVQTSSPRRGEYYGS